MQAKYHRILSMIREGRPLDKSMGVEVAQLSRGEYIHVTPTYTPGEVCPYRLTDKGREALEKEERGVHL